MGDARERMDCEDNCTEVDDNCSQMQGRATVDIDNNAVELETDVAAVDTVE